MACQDAATTGCPYPGRLSDAMAEAIGADGCCIALDGFDASGLALICAQDQKASLRASLTLLARTLLETRDAASFIEPEATVRASGTTFRLFGLRHDPGVNAPMAAASFAFDSARDLARVRKRVLELMPILQVSLQMLATSVMRDGNLSVLERECGSLRRALGTDAVTGLLNTHCFREAGRRRTLESGTRQALLLLDVLHGKRLDMLFGQAFTETYLAELAAALAATLPDAALIGRTGGGEFAVLVPLQGRPGSGALAAIMERCTLGLRNGADRIGRPDLGTALIGACHQSLQTPGLPDLMAKARAALRAARAEEAPGLVFAPAMAARYGAGEIDALFQDAVRCDRVMPWFQPLVDLQDGRCRGFEVLARWTAEDGAVLTPRDFAEVFSDHRIAEDLTARMLDVGLARFHGWCRRAGPAARGARLAVNMTAFDLSNPDLVACLGKRLTAAGLGWQTISLEVTETVILGDGRGLIFDTLQALRRLGAEVAMDDFGTGHGGFQHLRDWPVDRLKIDRDFVRGLENSRHDRAIVEAILNIARRSGIGVVIEGIETAAQLRALHAPGPLPPGTLGQGWLFDAALPPDAMLTAPLRYDIDPQQPVGAESEPA
ncbi:EAL domain-containing protein [Sagittula salina]|uniref:GGDEF domain-containing protein n=1 Tax=Sagittula salina TaxID=2820268 RepID=A0A940MM83_9RHOB|nr:bifunctional diguanylate cyclase/phosphodiesterase [Sagittula salina]MBP0481043.1 GGDEF domain-containing protein [Sagittula salina]